MYKCQVPGAPPFLIINSVHAASAFGSEYCIKALAETFATLRAVIYTLQTPNPDAEEVKKMLGPAAREEIFTELSTVVADLRPSDAYTEEERYNFKADDILTAEGKEMYSKFKEEGTPSKEAYGKVFENLARKCCKP